MGRNAGATTEAAPRRTDIRGDLVAAAVKLFSERGYHATSVNELVELADCTKGAFYHYFKSKEALLFELHDQFISYGLSKGQEIVALDVPPDEALTLLIRELLRQVELYRPQMMIAFAEIRHIDYEKSPEARRKRDAYERIVVTILERGIETGVFKKDLASTRILAFGIMGMCVWALQWFKPGGQMSAEEVGDLYATAILDGLMARPANG